MQPRVILFFINFFFSTLSALVGYILLPYLATLMPEADTGLVVTIGGAIALACFAFLPRLVARYGAQQLALILGMIEMIALFILAAAPGRLTSIAVTIIVVAIMPFLAYALDLLLESTGAAGGMTGRVRAVFLTAWNLGSFVAPLLIGTLLDGTNGYPIIFMAAAAAIMPIVVLFAARRLPHNGTPQATPILASFSCLFRNRDLAAVTIGHIFLWMFYVWAPLYVPVYLHTILGFSWTTLGWIFSIMLIPYVLIEYPAGWIADRYPEERHLMLAGFLIAGGALASVSLITADSSPIFILIILVTSRIGAALIEGMTEGHFFRRVSDRDINSMSIFRAAWPLAYAVAPLIGSTILSVSSYPTLFLITGGFLAVAGSVTTLFIQESRTARGLSCL
jgi:ACS family hexuronate transporter-like MFS transporter